MAALNGLTVKLVCLKVVVSKILLIKEKYQHFQRKNSNKTLNFIKLITIKV